MDGRSPVFWQPERCLKKKKKRVQAEFADVLDFVVIWGSLHSYGMHQAQCHLQSKLCWCPKQLSKIIEVHQLSKDLKQYVPLHKAHLAIEKLHLEDYLSFWEYIFWVGQCRLQGRGTHHTESYHQNRPRPVTWRVPTNSPLVQGWAYPSLGHGHSDHRNPGPMYRDHPVGPLQQYGPVKLEAGEILSKCQRLIHHSCIY